jgi:intermediate cleaving peptidase 55
MMVFMALKDKKHSLLTLHTIAHYMFIQELDRLGFRDPERDVERLFPHSIGHQLGMDLHDCPTVPYDEELRENMVITVEPGLYIPDSSEYPEKFRGIGVRLEDDVLIKREGMEILTSQAPKSPIEISG